MTPEEAYATSPRYRTIADNLSYLGRIEGDAIVYGTHPTIRVELPPRTLDDEGLPGIATKLYISEN